VGSSDKGSNPKLDAPSQHCWASQQWHPAPGTRRPDYLAAFYNVIDWNAVENRYKTAKG
jgi:hypothetical protein